MTIKQLQLAIEPTVHQAWNRKSGAEKLITKVLIGLAALAAGNSGYQLGVSVLAQITTAPGMWPLKQLGT